MPCQFVMREMLIIKLNLVYLNFIGHVTQKSLIIEFSSKNTKSELSAFITTQSQDHVTACIVAITLFIIIHNCVHSCVIDVRFICLEVS